MNSGYATWYEVATEVAGVLGVAARLKRMTMEDARFVAARPRFCALSNRKLAGVGFEMPAWQDALRRWLSVRRPLVPSAVDGRRVVDAHIE